MEHHAKGANLEMHSFLYLFLLVTHFGIFVAYKGVCTSSKASVITECCSTFLINDLKCM